MLQSMRKGAFSKVFMGLLLLGGVGLAVMDWQGAYTGGNLGGTDVARIGDNRVTMQDFDRTVRQNLQTAKIDPQQAYASGLVSHILNQLMTGQMLALGAHEAGITIGEQQLAGQLREMLKPITQSGASTRDALNTLVRASGSSEKALFAEIKQREASRLLADPLGGVTAFVPESMALDMARISQETRRVNILVLPHTSITTVKAPSEEQLTTYYETIKNKYQIPEKREAQLVILDASAMRDRLNIPEADIAAFYADNQSSFAVESKRMIAQIVTPDKAALDKAQASIKAGNTLEQAAAAAGISNAYQAPAAYSETALPAELATPAFAAKAGEILPPVQSPLGWHILEVTDIVSEGHKPLADVRTQIVQQLSEDRMATQLSDTANTLDDALAGGATLAEALKGLPAQITPISSVTRQSVSSVGALKTLPTTDQAQVADALFTLEEGETAPLFPLSDGRYATIRIEKVTPAVVPALSEKRDDVAVEWQKSQRQLVNLTQAQQMLTDLKTKKASLADLAKTRGVSIQSVTLTPGGNAPAPLSPQTRDQVKNVTLGDTALISEVDAVLIAQVDAVTYPPKGQITPQATADMSSAARDTFQTNVFDTLMQHISGTANVRVNQRLLERTYGRAADPQQP
ncbi:MAG: peptidyl-prolyl cis-trans isomerase [Pseudomonadota bacterium]